MPATNAPLDHLESLFRDTITVDVIASDLLTYPPAKDASEAHKKLEERNFDVCGVGSRRGGITGYVEREDLGSGTLADHAQEFTANHLIAGSTPLIDVLDLLVEESPLFVLSGSEVDHIVTTADLHKPPVRMLFYNVISALEMAATQFIETKECHWPGIVTDDAQKAAERAHSQRKKRDEETTLSACLPFSSKLRIVVEADSPLGRKDVAQTVKRTAVIEDIRNDIAHGHTIEGYDWPTIIEHVKVAREWTNALNKALDENKG